VHSSREGGDWSLDEKVVVVRHEDERVQDPAVDLDRPDEKIEKRGAVGFRAIDVLTLVAALRDVPDRAGILESQWA
jgi:hypothetical protein